MKSSIVREPMPYGKVLVVDDVEANLVVAQGLLRLYEINTVTVDSGFKAVEKVKSGEAYDIIFMDYMMPEMDGIETTMQIRELGYDGVIIALTANTMAGNRKMFMQNGFDEYISKPIDFKLFDDVLNRFIRDRHFSMATNKINSAIISPVSKLA